MRRRRKLNKKKVAILLIIIFIIITTPVFGRYVYNGIKEMYLSSKKFYFTSNYLGTNKTYTNWGGSEVYVVNFELYSYDNKLRKMTEDLDCVINAKIKSGSATCYIESEGSTSTQNTINASLNKTITVANDNKIKVTVYIVPTQIIANGSNIVVEVSATSVSPFEKKLSNDITLTSTAQTDYSIRDGDGDNYAELIVSNSKEQEVTVSLSFDPEDVEIDSNDEIFDDSRTTYMSTTVDGVDFISSVKFKLSGQSSKGIKFYKIDKNNDYTYEQNNNNYSTSVVTVQF